MGAPLPRVVPFTLVPPAGPAGLCPQAPCSFSIGLGPGEEPSGPSVSSPPTPLPTNDVDVYFETSAGDDNEHARFQKAKEQLEIRRNRMDRVNLSPLSLWCQGLRSWSKGHHLLR